MILPLLGGGEWEKARSGRGVRVGEKSGEFLRILLRKE